MKPRHALSDGPSFGAMGLPRRLQRLVLSLPTGLLLAVPIFAPADLLAQRWFDIGPVAGLAETVTTSDWTDSAGEAHRRRGSARAATAGIAVRTGLTEAISLQMELLHVRKGIKREGWEDARFDYVEMPLLMRVRVPGFGGSVRPAAILGVIPAREVGSDCWAQVFEGGRDDRLTPLSCRHWRQRQYDVGLAYGAGLALSSGRVTLSLESRRSHGTQDLAAGQDRSRRTHRTTMHLISGAIRLCSC